MALAKKNDEMVQIKAANIVRTRVTIVGTAPLVIHKFSQKAKQKMMDDMATPANDKKSKRAAKEARDYDADFHGARHISKEGWDGISAPAFRCAMIDACRTVGLVMTKAKMTVFVIADGFDRDDGTPLVRVISTDGPERSELPVRLENGKVDIRVRPMWREWSAVVTLEFDLDMISSTEVVNLLDRAGRQVGVGEGRPFSKESCGMGWGTFRVEES